MRKNDFYICKNKGTGLLQGNHADDQCLCFRYIDSTVPLLFKPLAIFCVCTAPFVLDQDGNPEDSFSQFSAHLLHISSAIYMIVLIVI